MRLGTSGSSVRGGGFRRRADWAGRDSEEELCSRARRGRGLLEGTTLEPGLWDTLSSGSLPCGEVTHNGQQRLKMDNFTGPLTPAANWQLVAGIPMNDKVF